MNDTRAVRAGRAEKVAAERKLRKDWRDALVEDAAFDRKRGVAEHRAAKAAAREAAA